MKILIAEDSAVARRLLEATIRRWGHEVIAVADGALAWQAMERPDAPTLVILDWMMPEIDGVEVCRRIRQRDDGRYTYVILLTAKNQKEDIVYAMDAGADDMIGKPFDSEELRVRVRAGERMLDLQARLLAAQESLRRQATHDSLTGLWNHGVIMELLEREFVRSCREGRSMGVIMADLDHFKRINDAYGHQVGDRVLQEVAGRLRESLREYDGAGRYGGEEFVIVAPNCDRRQAAGLAERIRTAIADRPFPTHDGTLAVTMSFGVTAGEPGSDEEAAHLIRAADEALYQAKEQGRNKVVVFGAEYTAGPEETALKHPATGWGDASVAPTADVSSDSAYGKDGHNR